MNIKEITTRHPFNLNEEQNNWVETTLNNLSIDEKIGQLFLLVAGMDPNEDTADIARDYSPGGFMYRPMPKDEIIEAHKKIIEASKVPPFLAANTEAGGNGIVMDQGTMVGPNMQVAATNDVNLGYKQGEVSAKELVGVGGNLSFAPVIDINMEWRNPIANLRSYSDDVQKVLEFGVANVKGTQENGAAVSVKHFPGDGVDSRDQHITTTMNHLTLSEWKETFGKVYNACFEAGALTTMVGHFFVPNIIEDLGVSEDKWIPTSYNKTILNKLLREELDYNGLILTDATQMAGMVTITPREEMVPLSIANGADVFLFVRNIDEDYQSMKKGLENGVLTIERLDEAVTRILATKAKLNLHIDNQITDEKISNVGSLENKEVEKEVADKSITLIKNEENFFPIKNVKKVKLITFFDKSHYGSESNEIDYIIEKFKKENVDVKLFDYANNPIQGIIDSKIPIASIKEEFDAVIYISSIQPSSNTSHLLIGWKAFVGMDAPNIVADIPTAWISLGSPYHLFDAPMVRNFINAYSRTNATIDALFEKMFGRSEFKGVSPVKHDVRYPNYKKALDIKYGY